MVNLIAINAHIFTELPTHFNNVVSSCLTILFTMFLLWRQLGVASLAGVTVILTVIPLTSFFTNASKKYQIKRLKYQDSRVKTLNELLNGIKVVKFYAWELSFKKLIDKIRSSELGLLRTISFLGGFTSFTLNITPFMVNYHIIIIEYRVLICFIQRCQLLRLVLLYLLMIKSYLTLSELLYRSHCSTL